VAAASAASSTLVRPEEADPQISLRHPRGSPPVSASISRIPLETISGEGRTSSRDAGVTPASLDNPARCFRTAAGSFRGAQTTVQPNWAEKSGEDMRPLKFSGNVRGGGASIANPDTFAFYSLKEISSTGKGCQEANRILHYFKSTAVLPMFCDVPGSLCLHRFAIITLSKGAIV
jgi:hypothetical protein